MATHQATVGVTLVAAEALAVGQTVEIDTSGEAAIPDAVTDVIVGVAGETVALGESVTIVQLQGIVEMIAGGTITAGQIVVPAATVGRVTGIANTGALAVDQMGIGVALDGASTGEVFRVFAQSIAAPHSA
jgi:hypothetical protein